jgi:predicted AAA+ superfamily ATPase
MLYSAIISLAKTRNKCIILASYQKENKMRIVGREKERKALEEYYNSNEPEFLAVYGRRRIGKTFLIREYFGNNFSFYVTGLANTGKSGQLRVWNIAINNSFGSGGNAENWLDAFELLKQKLMKKDGGRRKVLFIDEIPWMDTPKSEFLTALEHFWNSWASGRPDIFLIVCGSATSWIVNNLLKNRGGLHNRVTQRMRLLPFTLGETEAYLKEKEIELGSYQICEAYMVFGGVPYYYSLLGKGLSLSQNIDVLCFDETGILHSEFEEVFSSLFKNYENYIKVIVALSKKAKGLTRDEIIRESRLSSGGGLTKILQELELCGFIRSYPNFSKNNNLCLYQLIDSFCIFYQRFMSEKKTRNPRFWTDNMESPTLTAWKGFAYERLCLTHSEKIKQALGIASISTEISSWRSSKNSPGAQIDLIIDRKDGIINLCEMKFSKDKYSITALEEEKLRRRIAVFQAETQTKKAIHLTMVTTYGITSNRYSGIIQSQVTLDDLLNR